MEAFRFQLGRFFIDIVRVYCRSKDNPIEITLQIFASGSHMDDHIPFHLRAESVDGLHMLLGFLDNRLPYLIRCIQLFYELVARECPIMNDVTARSDVLAI